MKAKITLTIVSLVSIALLLIIVIDYNNRYILAKDTYMSVAKEGETNISIDNVSFLTKDGVCLEFDNVEAIVHGELKSDYLETEIRNTIRLTAHDILMEEITSDNNAKFYEKLNKAISETTKKYNGTTFSIKYTLNENFNKTLKY